MSSFAAKAVREKNLCANYFIIMESPRFFDFNARRAACREKYMRVRCFRAMGYLFFRAEQLINIIL